MLTEIIYKNGLYMAGTVAQVRLRLAEHTRKYETLLEMLQAKRPGDSSNRSS
ncbi:MAG TPA: hypothetical protein VNT57_06810 [Desulfobacteria bacterium]|nr:hypothetical protein [Desulfobacteria bacterium]